MRTDTDNIHPRLDFQVSIPMVRKFRNMPFLDSDLPLDVHPVGRIGERAWRLFSRLARLRAAPDARAVKSKPSQDWTLDSGGTGWAYLVSGPEVSAPVILVAERGRDAASLEAFADTVNGPTYPFGTELAARGRDTILVSYGPVADWDG